MAAASQVPSITEIREATTRAFGITPCIGQAKAALAQLENKSDVVYISGTGSGKTLTFWIPMLYETESITVLVTALNILGEQTAQTLTQGGITAINVTRANASPKIFSVCQSRYFLCKTVH